MKWLTLIICIIIAFLPAIIGSSSTRFSNTIESEWYQINQPSFTPPNWVFGPAWTILYLLIGISLYLAWTTSKNKNQRHKVATAFGINLLFNTLWSIFFFGYQLPLLAFVDILLIITTAVWMFTVTKKINKTAAYLLIPYIAWLLFAMALNLGFL